MQQTKRSRVAFGMTLVVYLGARMSEVAGIDLSFVGVVSTVTGWMLGVGFLVGVARKWCSTGDGRRSWQSRSIP